MRGKNPYSLYKSKLSTNDWVESGLEFILEVQEVIQDYREGESVAFK